MNFVLFIDKAFRKLQLEYRKYVFKKKIHCNHSNFSLYGKINLINTNVKIGHNVKLYSDILLYGDGPIVLGDNVDIGQGTIIYASKDGGGVYIGKNTLIAAQSYIIDTDHGIAADKLICEQPNTVAPITIGDDVWIAVGCKILKGSNIGNGAVIGASAVVKSDIPENSIAVGIPAKVIKKRM